MRTRIVYEDREILIACKPAGLPVQTAKIGLADMVSELKNYLAKSEAENGNRKKGAAAGREARNHQPYLGVVHRLDQPVEGLLVFAKTRQAAAALTKQLASGTLHKRYAAVVCGKPSQKEGMLVDYLYKDANNTARILQEGDAHYAEAKRAVLHYSLMKTVSKESDGAVQELSLLDITIETGRFHQIRAQMANAGMALMGDAKYAGEKVKQFSRQLGITSVALCACKISLKHPMTGEELCFETEPQGKAFSYFD